MEPAPRAPLPSDSARGPANKAPSPPATRRAVVRLLHLHVAPFSEVVLLLHLSAMRWPSVLRCGTADTDAPRYRVKPDSAFPRNSGGRSTRFPVMEEPTRLATLPPFSSRPTGRKPSLVDNLLPLTGTPLLKASAASAGPIPPSRTLNQARSATSATVVQWNRRNLTLPDEPVVTPRLPVRLIAVQSR